MRAARPVRSFHAGGAGRRAEGFRPKALTLDRVVVLMRHGVRAPLDGEVPHGTRTAKPWPIWTTPESELTPHGAEALAAEARADRADWIARGLLTEDCPVPGSIRIRTNSSSRTIASGEAYARALAPVARCR